MAAINDPSFLSPSELGNRDYWDKTYAQELTNHLDDPNEEGTIWFSESGAEERILTFLEDLEIDGSSEPNTENSNLRILDVGTGNGHLLFALRDEGWIAEMIGVDYSDASIQLAEKIQERRLKSGENQAHDPARFESWDLLRDPPGEWMKNGFDIVLDKGTFDAISLSDEVIENNQKGCQIYAAKVQSLVKDQGFVLVTSCNWTEDEIKKWFDVPELTVYGAIRFPHFFFGGVKGQAVSAVCFQRRQRHLPL